MPKIPTFEPRVSPTADGPGIELPMDANQPVAQAYTKRGKETENTGYRMAIIQARQQALEEKAKDTVDALKLEHEFKRKVDEHAESMKRVTNVDEVNRATEEFIQKHMEEYEGLQVKPHIKRSLLPSVLNGKLSVEKLARDKRIDIITNDGRTLWEQTKVEMEKMIRSASTQEEVEELQKRLELKGAELVDSNIYHGADMVKDLIAFKQKAQFNRAADQIDINAEEYLKTPNKVERYGLKDLDGTQLRELDRYAINKRDYMVHREEQDVKRMQDRNAETAYDKFKLLDTGKIDMKEWDNFMSSMRIPDAKGNFPMRRELMEHFEIRVDQMIRGGDKIPPNPILYNKLNERLVDGKNPLTFSELNQYSNQLPTSAFNHFSDKLAAIEIAEGKRGASSEKVKRAKLQIDIEKDEKVYIKSLFEGKSVDPDEMWKMNKDVEYTIGKMLDAGETDREKIHSEIKKIVEPKAHTWLYKMWKSIMTPDNENYGLNDVVPSGKDMATTAPQKVMKAGEAAEIFSDEEVKTWDVGRMSKRLQTALKMKKEDADVVAVRIKEEMSGGPPPNELPKGWTRKGNEVYNEKGKKMKWVGGGK